MKDYIEIEVTTNKDGADFLSALFFDFNAEGVEIKDPTEIENVIAEKGFWDYVDESLLNIKDTSVVVKAFFKPNVNADEIVKAIGELDCVKSDVKVFEKESEDWSVKWRAFYKPRKIGNLIIKHEWEEYNANDNEVVFTIEPGQAFGTGEHESTSMCLTLAQKIDLKDKTVLDIGCGSGILGISAVLLGARNAVLTDLDGKAVEIAKDNVKKNGVDKKIKVLCEDLSTSNYKYDIVFANLTADLLIRLSKRVSINVRSGGYMIVSGIIKEREQEVVDAFSSVGFTVKDMERVNSWTAFILRKA